MSVTKVANGEANTELMTRLEKLRRPHCEFRLSGFSTPLLINGAVGQDASVLNKLSCFVGLYAGIGFRWPVNDGRLLRGFGKEFVLF